MPGRHDPSKRVVVGNSCEEIQFAEPSFGVGGGNESLMFVKNGNLNETDLCAPRLYLKERDRAG